MMNIFKISEIVDLGIEKEKRRRDFYDMASKRFKEQELKALFERLRDWEETHVQTFSQIRDSLVSDEVAEVYPGELSQYMQSVVDEKLYASIPVREFEKSITNIKDAIRYAIGFEKDAILFFNELLMYTVLAHKEIILKLIHEEKLHIVYLAQMKEKLKL